MQKGERLLKIVKCVEKEPTSAILRNAFVQMTMGIILSKNILSKKNYMLYLWVFCISKRRGHRKGKIALIRKMVVIVRHMLKNKAEFAYKSMNRLSLAA